jgi:hypothetical protein
VTIDEFVRKAGDLALAEPHLRWGQAVFHTLYDVRPDLAHQDHRRQPRPLYYQDSVPMSWWRWLEDNWDTERLCPVCQAAPAVEGLCAACDLAATSDLFDAVTEYRTERAA